MEVELVQKSKISRAINEITRKQRIIVSVNNAPLVELQKLHNEALNLVSMVDVLRTLELLEDEQYQELVENNVMILNKLEERIVAIKRSLTVCQPIRRIANISM